MLRSSRLAVVPLLAAALLAPTPVEAGPPPARPTAATAAVALQPLVVKTVQIGDRRVRFVLAVDADEQAYVQMKFRRDGRWRTVASDKTDCLYHDGSHDPGLEVQKPVRQVFVTWSGPGEDAAAEYGGYRVGQRTLTMYGADTCPAAG